MKCLKKEEEALRLKSDSFIVESNVHFPTDYNLLWDCARKCLDTVDNFLKKYDTIEGWRKISNWRHELKGLMREVGKASKSGGKNKAERLNYSTNRYLRKAKSLVLKLETEVGLLPLEDESDLGLHLVLDHFTVLLKKHISLVHRRIIQGEKIPHQEKMFSVFETYTEMVKKGKLNPNIEFGKQLNITTDQYGLIIDYYLMHEEQDCDVVIGLADRVLSRFRVQSWSFDKGYWNKDNKLILQLEIPEVIMPKLGKRNQKEEAEETSRKFKLLKNKHSAIESNINELEHRGLDRCPDKGIFNLKRYVSLAVCSYNLKKIEKLQYQVRFCARTLRKLILKFRAFS